MSKETWTRRDRCVEKENAALVRAEEKNRAECQNMI